MTQHRRGSDAMTYLDEPVWFRAHGHDCLALVIDRRRVFARWFDGGTVHLAWVQHGTPVGVA